MLSLFAPSASLGQNDLDNDLSERHCILIHACLRSVTNFKRTVSSVERFCSKKDKRCDLYKMNRL